MSWRTSLSPLLLAAALAWGCTKEQPPPQEDRTLAKLRAEADRVEKGGAPSHPPERTAPPQDPNASLADLATADPGTSEHKLRLPEPNDTKHVDTVAVKLVGLESSHSVQRGKVSLTTEDIFLRVQLVTQNVGTTPAPLNLQGSRVVDSNGKVYSVARDAQLAGGTRELQHTWAPDERLDMVLFFEVPPSALDSGLTLVLPATSGDLKLTLR